MGAFTNQLKTFQKNTEEEFSIVLRLILYEIAKRVIERTPVKTGRAKKNWQVTINVSPDGWREIYDKTSVGIFTDQRALEIIGALSTAKAGDTLYLTNGVPYILDLETGTSRQAPEGMVAITVREFQAIVKKVVADHGLRKN